MDGQTTDGRTDAGRIAMAIAHLRVWLRWAKHWKIMNITLGTDVKKKKENNIAQIQCYIQYVDLNYISLNNIDLY